MPTRLRVWFNQTFSSVQGALRLIAAGDRPGRYEIVASHPNPQAVVRLAANHFFVEPPDLDADRYPDWCLETCRTAGIDLFVPGRGSLALADRHALFATAGTRVLSAAAAASLERLNDKARFYAELVCPAAPAPDWIACQDAEGFEAALATLAERHAEICIKPARSVFGIGFRQIVRDRRAFQLLMADEPYSIDLPGLRSALAGEKRFATMLVMEFLPGAEYSVDCIADHGRLICAIPRRKPLTPGHPQVIDCRADILEASRTITAQFGLNGYANIQFREGTQGLRTLEVNPRLSGGVAMACLAGPNLPHLGLAGFDCGYEGLEIGSIQDGLRVTEIQQAVALQ